MKITLEEYMSQMESVWADYAVNPDVIWFGTSLGCVCLTTEGMALVDDDGREIRELTAEEYSRVMEKLKIRGVTTE